LQKMPEYGFSTDFKKRHNALGPWKRQRPQPNPSPELQPLIRASLLSFL
jgi:hypothetical protein